MHRKLGGLRFRVFGVLRSYGLRVFVLEVFVLETPQNSILFCLLEHHLYIFVVSGSNLREIIQCRMQECPAPLLILKVLHITPVQFYIC